MNYNCKILKYSETVQLMHINTTGIELNLKERKRKERKKQKQQPQQKQQQAKYNL